MAIEKHLVKVTEKVNLAGKFWALKLEKPTGFSYIAGQYVSIKVAEDGTRRSYSLGSIPSDDYLELIFDIKPGGLGSNFLVNLEVGSEIEILGPMGRFVVNGELDNRKLLYIGTGSGIVPLWAMIKDLLVNKEFKGEIKLHWGMRDDNEVFLVKQLDDLKERCANFSYDIVMSQASEKWPNCRGHVQDCLVGHGQNWTSWEVYLCGAQKMVIDVAGLMIEKGVEKDKVFFEKFY